MPASRKGTAAPSPQRSSRRLSIASGPLVLQILNVLQRLNFTGGPNDWASAQKVIETFKFAYVDRMKMGDPAFIADPDGIVARIVSAERAAQIAPRIHVVNRHTPIES